VQISTVEVNPTGIATKAQSEEGLFVSLASGRRTFVKLRGKSFHFGPDLCGFGLAVFGDHYLDRFGARRVFPTISASVGAIAFGPLCWAGFQVVTYVSAAVTAAAAIYLAVWSATRLSAPADAV
jgi:hypothetical protein